MASDLLFRLIKSLDKNEKGYFKKQAKQYASKQAQIYLLLFDAIDKQTEYDEAAIKKKHFASAKASTYSQTKGYLLDNILKSLTSYHQGKSVKDTIQILTNSIQALFGKKMRQDALPYILKAKKLAYAVDDILSVIKMIHLERSVMAAHFKDDFLEEGLILEAEEGECLKYLQAQNQLSIVYTKLHYMMRKVRFVADENRQAELGEIMNDPILKETFYLERPRGNTLFNTTMVRYYDFVGDFEKSFQHSELGKESWDRHLVYKQENPWGYLGIISNYTAVCWRADHPEKILPALESVLEMKPKEIPIKLRQFEVYHMGVLTYHSGSMTFDEYIPKIDPFLKELEIYKDKLSGNFTWMYIYNASILCMYTARYEKALELVNMIYTDGDHGLLIGFKRTILIENLILHYELGNFDSLPYYIKSAERHFKKMEYGELEMSFIQFLKKVIATAPSDRKDVFRAYLVETEQIEERSPAKESILQILNWKEWLQSVIKNKRIAEVKKEQLLAN